IYGDVLDWLAHQHGPVLDLYAGCGVLSLLLAQRGGEVVAVERSPAAVAVARRAMARDGHTYHLHQGDSLGLSLQMIRARARFPGAVVNPPRCGLHPRLPEALAGLGVRRLAYISCDPATMARDLGRLGGLGFHTVQVTPYDLFTHTAGIEVVARLHRPPQERLTQ
ncbi:MAG: methyltransferase domain-containing protein, partial [Acidobacteriota bacterium]